jgi:hypothetical protein
MLRRANARRLVWTARGAEDRRAAQAELALETADDLTGALRRNAGLEALRRELERRNLSGLHERFVRVGAELAQRHNGAGPRRTLGGPRPG